MTSLCSVDWCDKRAWARGWCSAHYRQWSRYGAPRTEPPKDRTAELLSRILLLPDCWLWMGYRDARGYGGFQFEGQRQQAHRAVYEHYRGPIPDGLVLDHLCRVHCCVNPLHLEAVTVRENNLRGVSIQAQNAAKTHCKRGHPLVGRNLMSRPDRRECRTCALAGAQALRDRRKVMQCQSEELADLPEVKR